jgi:F-type H+-transporting ATPase subunit delta
MSELMTLARPYAVAAFARAKETGTLDRWQETLEFLRLLLTDSRMKQAANNPKADREAFLRALLDLCAERVDAESANFVRLLVQNRRLDLIQDICTLFSHYRAEDEGTIDVAVATAYPLDDHQQHRIAGLIEKLMRRNARLSVRQDESLIGGVIIHAGDRVIDASIRGQLQRLQKSLCN